MGSPILSCLGAAGIQRQPLGSLSSDEGDIHALPPPWKAPPPTVGLLVSPLVFLLAESQAAPRWAAWVETGDKIG